MCKTAVALPTVALPTVALTTVALTTVALATVAVKMARTEESQNQAVLQIDAGRN